MLSVKLLGASNMHISSLIPKVNPSFPSLALLLQYLRNVTPAAYIYIYINVNQIIFEHSVGRGGVRYFIIIYHPITTNHFLLLRDHVKF